MLSITIRKEFLFMVVFGVAFVYGFIALKRNRCSKNKSLFTKDMIRIATMLYAAAVFGITLFPIAVPPSAEPYQMDFVNWDMRNMFLYGDMRSLLANIIGNVLLFVPLLPLIQLNRGQKKITAVQAGALAFMVSIVIEGLQSFENITAISAMPIRISDISDVMLNYIGGLLGYGAFRLWENYFAEKLAKA